MIASTPQTRSISNDPTVAGLHYTRMLQQACSVILKHYDFGLQEREVVVLNILRGALNFGLRDALADAYGWFRHNTSFISAQRARDDKDSESWHITEKGYKKIFFPQLCSLVMGDVVATGTSLQFAMHEIVKVAVEQKVQLRHIVFFTYGGEKAEQIFEEIDNKCRFLFAKYEQTYVIYLEGRFTVPVLNTPLSIRLTGTDLLRYHALMAPEFVESQYESPSYPLERCTIYDAGSRAFWIPEYVDDVESYWHQTLELAQSGVSFRRLLHERFPGLSTTRFGHVDLQELCISQISKMRQTFQ
ncbi:MAG: hypothetical protein IJ244_05365 [Bacteroidaceae bacterium]|nr:hypothetical protein [Bacteroidaceae bacterium]